MQKERKMKMKLRKKTKRLLTVMNGLAFYMLFQCQTVLAKEDVDVSSVTKPINNLKTLIFAIIGAMGYIVLGKNIMEFAQAYQDRDSGSMNSALKGIVGGAIMAGISTVITIVGF